jgi:anaerobic ribonucleoside-triphosphate reductase activating protein
VKIRIAGIVKESFVDGPGIRYVIFTQGCIHKCEGCQNPETHDLDGGYEIDIKDIIKDINTCTFLNGITFSGGEPFLQADALCEIARYAKEKGLDIVTYTGFTYEKLIKKNNTNIKNLLSMTDILIDGKFELSEKDISLKFRGSRNQRVIDVKNSLNSKLPVLLFE